MYKISNNNINTFNEYAKISYLYPTLQKSHKTLYLSCYKYLRQHINLLHNFIIIKLYELKIIIIRYICIKYLYITNIYGNNRIS